MEIPARTPVTEVLGVLTVPGRQEHVSQARHFVAHLLRHHPDRCTAVLLTSEFVTNGVQHGAGAVTVVVLRTGRGVRIEVTDSGTAGQPVLRASDADAENGRGLLLVDRMAARWDHVRSESGLTTWFELDTVC
jgi:anti-sigma regulatory factor (Ser/Thr protein kinase)